MEAAEEMEEEKLVPIKCLTMCGRYRLSRRAEAIARYFHSEYEGIEFEARYNIAPTQQVPVIRQPEKESVRRASLMKWGLVPSWAKDPSMGIRMINARAETAATKPAYKNALQRRRCLIPGDGFYEWQRTTRSKQPFCFEVNDGEVFAFAGLWDRWRAPDGSDVETCTILTTTPNQLLADVHYRMPVILPTEHYDLWLDPGSRNVEAVTKLLKPYDARQMRRYPVGTRINAVANDDAACAEPLSQSPPQQGLF